MLQRMLHTGIQVRDLDKSIAFYTDVLGLTLRLRVRLNETTELAFLPLGGSEIELICRSGDYAYAREGIVNHVAMQVESVAAMLEYLKGCGVSLANEEPLDRPNIGARLAFFWGPDGEKLELIEPAEQPAVTGVVRPV